MGGTWWGVPASLGVFYSQSLNLIVKVLVALLIWWLGKKLLGAAVKLVSKFDLGIKSIPEVVEKVGKAVLVLVVLDYLGIGRTIIAALVNGLTIMIAIALGLAFGQALTPEAKKMVARFQRELKAK